MTRLGKTLAALATMPPVELREKSAEVAELSVRDVKARLVEIDPI